MTASSLMRQVPYGQEETEGAGHPGDGADDVCEVQRHPYTLLSPVYQQPTNTHHRDTHWSQG